jgi:hypothetical protein
MSETPPAWAGCDSTARDWRNQKRLLWTLFGWSLCFVGGSFLLSRELLPAGPLRWLVAVVPTVVGAAAMLAYARFLREADELQRMIQLQALAVGFGATWLAITGYELLERVGAPPADAGNFVLVLAGGYSISVVLGRRRYL